MCEGQHTTNANTGGRSLSGKTRHSGQITNNKLLINKTWWGWEVVTQLSHAMVLRLYILNTSLPDIDLIICNGPGVGSYCHAQAAFPDDVCCTDNSPCLVPVQ